MIYIYHHNDPDGCCAGEIAHQYFEDQGAEIQLYSVDYRQATELNFHHIYKDDIVVIVDFSFPPDTMNRLLARGVSAEHIIWIDHHLSAKGYPSQYRLKSGEHLAGILDTSGERSGCLLAWEYFFPQLPVPEIVELLSDYDTFKLRLAPRSIQFFEGLKSYPYAPKSIIWKQLGLLGERSNKPKYRNTDHKVEELIHEGQVCIRYRSQYGKWIVTGYGYWTEIGCYKAVAINCFGLGSLVYDSFPELEDVPIKICYIYDGEKFTVSLYSSTVDVSVIAKKYGGGGHKGAAGFVCRELPFKYVREIKGTVS